MANEEEEGATAKSSSHATRLKIWVLVWGCRGDAVPFAALARALQDDGHRLVVLGWSNLESLFPGMKFRALDADSATRCEKVRFWMQDRAGWTITNNEDFMLDMDVRKYEYITWLELDSRRKGLSEDAIANLLKPKQEALDALRFSEELDERRWASEQESQHRHMLERLAKEAGRDPVEYDAERSTFRAAFMERLSQEAESQGFKPRDLLHSIYLSFRKELAVWGKMMTDAGHDRKGLIKILVDFISWTEGTDVNDWWKGWQPRLPGMDLWLDDSLFLLCQTQQVLMRRNVIRYISEVRPQLVIYPPTLMSIAGSLQAWTKCSILQAWPRVPVLDLGSQLNYYYTLMRLERESQAKLTRQRYYHMAMIGPMVLCGRFRSARQLLGLTPVLFHEDKVIEELSKDKEWIQKFRSVMLGQWVLSQEHVSEHLFFGGHAAKEAASAFIAAGSEPPVYIGFGQGRHPAGAHEFAALVVKALSMTKRRGIFVSNWPALTAEVVQAAIAQDPELAGYGEHVLFLRAVPHDWLFPQCVCAVTHGGLGTLGAALRAGLPTVCSPVGRALVSSSRHINALGCGLGMIEDFQYLSFPKLASAMKQVIGNEAMVARAKAVASTMKGELGVTGAAKLAVLLYKEGTEDEEPKTPWAEGFWDIYNSRAEHAQVEVHGTRFYYPGNSDPNGRLQAGNFVAFNSHGLEQECNVQAMFPTGIVYGTVESNGEVIKWNSDELWRLRRVIPKSCQCPVF